MMSRVWQWCVLVLVLVGCGGASPGSAAKTADMSGGMPAAPMADRDYDGVQDSVDEAPAEEMEASPGSARGGETLAMRPQIMGQAAGAPPGPAPTPAKEKPDVPTPNPAGQPGGKKEAPGESPGSNAPSAAGPLLIYRATLHMAVFETKKSLDEVEKLAKDVGGYLVSREDTSITVRVPSKKFDGAVDRIGKLGDMLHRNVSVDDVTEQFHDMQIRLRNLEVVRNRLEELLKKAANVTEAITVERELERVTTEIERLKGRLKLLSELIQFSTITVNFQPRPTDHVESQVRLPFPWLDSLGLGELLRL